MPAGRSLDYMQLPSWQTANRIATGKWSFAADWWCGIICHVCPSRHTARSALWRLSMVSLPDPARVRLGFLNAWENLWYGPGIRKTCCTLGTAALGLRRVRPRQFGYCRKYNEAVRARYQAFLQIFAYIPACRIDHRHWLIFGGLLLVFSLRFSRNITMIPCIIIMQTRRFWKATCPFLSGTGAGRCISVLIYLSSKLFGYNIGQPGLMALMFYLAAAVLLQKIFLLLDFRSFRRVGFRCDSVLIC